MFTLWYADQILTNSGAANFTGTSTFTFSQTGNFVAGSVTGNANFVGTSTLTFSQTGVFNAFASMAGTATATFGQSGAVTAESSFSGTSSTLFAQSGAFVAGAAAGNAVFVGTATITFGQSGDLNTSQIVPNQQMIGAYAFRVSRQKQLLAKEAERVLNLEKIHRDDDEIIMAVLEEFMRLAA